MNMNICAMYWVECVDCKVVGGWVGEWTWCRLRDADNDGLVVYQVRNGRKQQKKVVWGVQCYAEEKVSKGATKESMIQRIEVR